VNSPWAVVLVAACACTESSSSRRAGPGGSEARDRESLAGVVAVDMRASQAMRDADEAATKGDAGAALAIVEKRATPAVDEGLGLVDRAGVETPWGKQKRDALGTVLRDRKREMPRYEEAVRSGDLEKMLVAMQAQAEIEKRAIGTVADLGPGR
jgi:hypothetical protein